MCSKEPNGCLPAIVRGPTWVSMDGHTAPLPGSTDVCLLQFQFPGSVNVHSIRFKNNYAHSICVKSRAFSPNFEAAAESCNLNEHFLNGTHAESSSSFGQTSTEINHQAKIPWEIGIKKKILMPHPDFEDGSQNFFQIQANESMTSWSKVSSFIFILRQPAKCWKTFSIQEIEIRGTQNLAPPAQPIEEAASAADEGTESDGQPTNEPDPISTHIEQLLKIPAVEKSVSDIVKLFQHFRSLDL